MACKRRTKGTHCLLLSSRQTSGTEYRLLNSETEASQVGVSQSIFTKDQRKEWGDKKEL